MSTGDADLADDPNTSGSSGAANGGGNIRGDTDFDVSIIKIDMSVPAEVNCLRVSFRFLSEEFPEYVGSSFNDAFIAELDSSTWTTSGTEISAPDNFAFDQTGGEISVNAAGVASMTEANATGTTYDGATPTLNASTPISPGSHSLYLSILDQGDTIYDSAVFLDNVRFEDAAGGDCNTGIVQDSPEPDFNGDGYADQAIGIPGEDFGATTDGGLVQVIYGSATGLDRSTTQQLHQNVPGITDTVEVDDRFGEVLSSGDLNGDSFDDLIVGTPGEDFGAITDGGLVQVIYGSATGLDRSTTQQLHQNVPGITDTVEVDDRFGEVLS